MITETGVRVLDFGLARGVVDTGENVDTEIATQPALTAEGRVPGTMPYMAPEQLRGRQADARTDIWALGCLMFEMATGTRPFQGDSHADLIASIMGSEPAPVNERRLLPGRLYEIVKRCLEKAPERRWQSSQDLKVQLDTVDVDSLEISAVQAPGAASIAVLSFADMSPSSDQEYFCDGLADELINQLTKIEELHVVARTSAFQFKGRSVDVREVGRRLGVAHVLEGSLRKAGNRVRLSGQLIDVESGFQLWSQRFDRELDDVFAIQDEIATAVADQLKVTLIGEPVTPAKAATHRPSREVYDLQLQASFHLSQETPDGIDTAVRLLEEAIELDPRYARAHALRSHCFSSLGLYGFRGVQDVGHRADFAARKALELDPLDEKAHHALGLVLAWLHWDWEGAEASHRRALELNPGDASARRGLGANVLMPTGRTRPAIRELRKACTLNPLSPLASRTLGEMLFMARRYDEAIEQLKRTVRMAPDFPRTQAVLAQALDTAGLHEQAAQELESLFTRHGRPELAARAARAFREEPDGRGVTRWQLQRALSRATSEWDAWNIALLHARLGEVGASFTWLERAQRRPGLLITYASVHPWLDCLRGTPRFDQFLGRMGLEDPGTEPQPHSAPG
jgi:serine/threonine-protein kinase